MIELKDYQHRVLDSLTKFLRLCSKSGSPESAYRSVTEEVYGQPLAYFPVQVPGLSHLPYVCLRVPTGGGKTLIACHAAGIAVKDLLHSERGIVLWLVPSNTILDQTADALRDPRHPYRRALEQSCGAVEVLTIEEALNMPRSTVDGQTVVIVSTIQCFRVEDTTGRKVYGESSVFQDHFLNVPANRLADLEAGADGRPRPTLVNMLRLRRPVVIVDEAHNARTDLSFLYPGIHGNPGENKECFQCAAPGFRRRVESGGHDQATAPGDHATSQPERPAFSRSHFSALRSGKSGGG
jgi:type III restriction enzyme